LLVENESRKNESHNPRFGIMFPWILFYVCFCRHRYIIRLSDKPYVTTDLWFSLYPWLLNFIKHWCSFYSVDVRVKKTSTKKKKLRKKKITNTWKLSQRLKRRKIFIVIIIVRRYLFLFKLMFYFHQLSSCCNTKCNLCHAACDNSMSPCLHYKASTFHCIILTK
jgi:hypothetical protein